MVFDMDDRQRQQLAQIASALNQYTNSSNALSVVERSSRDRLTNDGRSSTGSTCSGSSNSSGNAAALWSDLTRALQFGYANFPSGTSWHHQAGSDRPYSNYSADGSVEGRTEMRRIPSKGETKATPPLPPGISSNLGAASLQQLVGIPNDDVYRSLLAQQYAAAFSGIPPNSHPPISPVTSISQSSPSPGQVRASPISSRQLELERQLQYQMFQKQQQRCQINSQKQKCASPLSLLSVLPPLPSPDCSFNEEYIERQLNRQLSPLIRTEKLVGQMLDYPLHNTNISRHNLKLDEMSPDKKMKFSDDEYDYQSHSDKSAALPDYRSRSSSESDADLKARNRRRKQGQPKRQSVIYSNVEMRTKSLSESADLGDRPQNIPVGLNSDQLRCNTHQEAYSEESDFETISPVDQATRVIVSQPSYIPSSKAMSHALSHPFLAGHIDKTLPIPNSHSQFQYGESNSCDKVISSQFRYDLSQHKSHLQSDFSSTHSDTSAIRDTNCQFSHDVSTDQSYSSSNNTSYDSTDKAELSNSRKATHLSLKENLNSIRLCTGKNFEATNIHDNSNLITTSNYKLACQTSNSLLNSSEKMEEIISKTPSEELKLSLNCPMVTINEEEIRQTYEPLHNISSESTESQKSNEDSLNVKRKNGTIIPLSYKCQSKFIIKNDLKADENSNELKIAKCDIGQLEEFTSKSKENESQEQVGTCIDTGNLKSDKNLPHLQSQDLKSFQRNSASEERGNSVIMINKNSSCGNTAGSDSIDGTKENTAKVLESDAACKETSSSPVNQSSFTQNIAKSDPKIMVETQINSVICQPIGSKCSDIRQNNKLGSPKRMSVINESDTRKCSAELYKNPIEKASYFPEMCHFTEESKQSDYLECQKSPTRRTKRQKRPVSYVEAELDPFIEQSDDVVFTSPMKKRGRRPKDHVQHELHNSQRTHDLNRSFQESNKSYEFHQDSFRLNKSLNDNISYRNTSPVCDRDFRDDCVSRNKHFQFSKNFSSLAEPLHIDTNPGNFSNKVPRLSVRLPGQSHVFNDNHDSRITNQAQFEADASSPTSDKVEMKSLGASKYFADTEEEYDSKYPNKRSEILNISSDMDFSTSTPVGRSSLPPFSSSKIIDQVELQLAAFRKVDSPQNKVLESVLGSKDNSRSPSQKLPHKPGLSMVPIEKLTYEDPNYFDMESSYTDSYENSGSYENMKDFTSKDCHISTNKDSLPMELNDNNLNPDMMGKNYIHSSNFNPNILNDIIENMNIQQPEVRVVSVPNATQNIDLRPRRNSAILNSSESDLRNTDRPNSVPVNMEIFKNNRSKNKSQSSEKISHEKNEDSRFSAKSSNPSTSMTSPLNKRVKTKLFTNSRESSSNVSENGVNHSTDSTETSLNSADQVDINSISCDGNIPLNSSTETNSGRPRRTIKPPKRNDGELTEYTSLLNMENSESEDEDYVPKGSDSSQSDSNHSNSDQSDLSNSGLSQNSLKNSDLSLTTLSIGDGNLKSVDNKVINGNKKRSRRKKKRRIKVDKIKYRTEVRQKEEKFVHRRGPVLKISKIGKPDKILNTSNKDEGEKEKTKKSSIPFYLETDSVSKSAKIGFHSTLHNNYDAFNKDTSWFCCLCKNFSHYRTLGDLFGPIFIKNCNVLKKVYPDIKEGQVTVIALSPTTQKESVPSTSKTKKKLNKRESISGEAPQTLMDKKEAGFCSPPPSRFVPAATPARFFGRSPSSTDGSPRTPFSPKKANSASVKSPNTDFSRINGEGETWKPPGTECWIHEDCLLWCNGVIVSNSKLCGLEAAVLEAQQSVCTFCGETGATVSCLNRKCTEAFVHVPCARLRKWILSKKNFQSFCSKHGNVGKK